MFCVVMVAAALIMDYMSVGVVDGSAACDVATDTAAANTDGFVIIDYSMCVPKVIRDTSCGGSVQGYCLLIRVVVDFT